MDTSKALDAIDFSPEINMARYLQKIRLYPILTHENEYNLATNYQATKDPKIAIALITSHLRLVVKVVSKYKGYGLASSELISEGNIGLLHAIEKFDPTKGFRFSTYAMWWIKASIQKYILNSWSMVKIGTTAAQKKLFFNLRKIKNKLDLKDDREMSETILTDIAESLNVSVSDVKSMNTRIKSHDTSLNIVIDSSTDSGAEWQDFVIDNRPNQEDVLTHSDTASYRRKLFNQSLCCLNKREKDILFKRRLCDKSVTLDELSKIYNISKERVRQIELNSIRKIKKTMGLEN